MLKRNESEKPEDAVRKLIRDRIVDLRLTMSSVSKKLGRNHAWLQQFLKRGVPLHLPEIERSRLADILEVDENSLRSAELQRGTEATTIRPQQNARIAGNVQIARTIPAYGHARGGRDGQFVLNGNKVADVLAPPSLAGVPDAYAVYVVGSSMEPRYFAGETVFINPRLPLRRGCFVVAQIAASEGDPPDAYVKRFISMDAKVLKLEQYNPKKTLAFPADRVVTVHRIIMGGEG